MNQDHTGLWINNQWQTADGAAITVTGPATGETLWGGRSASPANVDAAVGAARHAALR